ncbi:MAG: Uma2 family endonuclease [Acidobacteria bacterium]|nr:Uma2 family endonuclease [Acidobacteriota bacterium]
MPRKQTVPVEDYLDTVYEPDCEFADGGLIQRHELSEQAHFLRQRFLSYFQALEDPCHIRVLNGQRLCTLDSVRSQRFRIPDICLVRRPFEPIRILRKPPLLAIDVLRAADAPGEALVRLSELLRMGVPHIWALDPEAPRVFTVSRQGVWEVTAKDLTLPELNLVVPLYPFFKDLEGHTGAQE